MLKARILKAVQMAAVGAMLLQVGGCDFATFNEVVQTILLGITAAGGVAILRNV